VGRVQLPSCSRLGIGRVSMPERLHLRRRRVDAVRRTPLLSREVQRDIPKYFATIVPARQSGYVARSNIRRSGLRVTFPLYQNNVLPSWAS